MITKIDRMRAVVGTLAHNRSFTAAEITEYTRFDPTPLDGPAVVRSLLKQGLIERMEKRGHYYPTVQGWAWIESDLI